MIQLLTPQPNYSDEFNEWLRTIPEHVYALALIIKRFIGAEKKRIGRIFSVSISSMVHPAMS